MIDLRLGDCLDVLKTLPAGSVHTCITSPPYFGLRDYGADGQIGLEATPEAFVATMVEVFREVRRVLRDDGTAWLNLGDSYNGGGGYSSDAPSNVARGGKNNRAKTFESSKRRGLPDLGPKQLLMIPHRVALALQADGWLVRSDIVWHKPNPMPESVRDRPTKAHEYIFLLAKSERYYYDADAIREPLSCPDAKGIRFGGTKYPGADFAVKRSRSYSGNVYDAAASAGRNKRSVWTVATRPFSAKKLGFTDVDHFATFPPALIEPCVLAGCPVGGTVLDPFNGAGTTGLVAVQHGRRYIGIDLNPRYLEMSRARIAAATASEAA